MDPKNRYHTNATYLHMRLEFLAVIVICSVMVLMHAKEVNWWRFAGAMLYIDLIGYIPGAIVYHRQGGGPIPKIYHYLYNIMHSFLQGMVAVAIWAWLGGFEWAMLAIPIHLSGDRGIFGNVLKPTTLSFEPVKATPPDLSGEAA